MTRWLAIFLFLAVQGGFGGVAAGGDCTGMWKLRYLYVTAEADVEQQGDAIRGVAFVHGMSGKTDVYHFAGTVRGDDIQASHGDGHSFRGRIDGPEEISGVLTTRTGMRLDIRAERCKQKHSSEPAAGNQRGILP